MKSLRPAFCWTLTYQSVLRAPTATTTTTTRLKLLDHVVSGVRFLTRSVFECNITHRRSVAVLCMLYNVRCKPIHPLYGPLPVPYKPVQDTRGAMVAHRYTYAPPSCRTSQYRRTFSLLLVSLWNDLVDPVFDGVGLAGFKSRANVFFISLCCSIPFCLYYFYISLLSADRCWYCGAGVFGLIVPQDFYSSLSISLERSG